MIHDRKSPYSIGDLVISEDRVWVVGLVNDCRMRIHPVTSHPSGKSTWDPDNVGPFALLDDASDYEFDERERERLANILEEIELESLLDEERRIKAENRRIEREEAEAMRAHLNTPVHLTEYVDSFNLEGEDTMAVAEAPVGKSGAAPKETASERIKRINRERMAKLNEKKEANKAAREKEKAEKPPREKKVREPKPCQCGCGEQTGGFFVPGHDARFKGWLLKIERGEAKKEDLLTAAVIGKYKWVASGIDGKAGKGQRPTTNYKGEPHSGYVSTSEA